MGGWHYLPAAERPPEYKQRLWLWQVWEYKYKFGDILPHIRREAGGLNMEMRTDLGGEVQDEQQQQQQQPHAADHCLSEAAEVKVTTTSVWTPAAPINADDTLAY